MKTTTTVRFMDGTEVQLPGTNWRIGDTFRTYKGGKFVIVARAEDGMLMAGW